MSLGFAFKTAGGDVFVGICPQPMILHAGLGGFNVGIRGCSSIAAEDLCRCMIALKGCGFFATDPVNTARMLLTKLGRD